MIKDILLVAILCFVSLLIVTGLDWYRTRESPTVKDGCRFTITAYLPDDSVKRYYTNDYVANSEGVSFFDFYHGQILLHNIPVMVQSREKDADYHKRPKDFRADEVDWLDGQDKLNGGK